MTGQGFFGMSFGAQGIAEIVISLGAPGIDLYGAAVADLRLPVFAQPLQRVAQVDARREEIGLQRQRLSIAK